MIRFHAIGDINLLSSHPGVPDNNFFEDFIAWAREIIVLVFVGPPLGKEGAAVHFSIYTLYS